MDIPVLAEQISSSRSHLTQVLLGQRKGSRTWDKLKTVLTEEEYKAAKEYADKELALRVRAGKSVGAFPAELVAASSS